MLLVTIKRKTRLMTNDALLDGEYSMDSGKLDQTWADICAQIKSYNNIDPSQINAFFSRLQPQAMSEGFLMLTADNDFIKTWIERHYVDFIKQALLDLFHIPFTVVIEVDITTAANSASRERGSRPRFRPESHGEPAVQEGISAGNGRATAEAARGRRRRGSFRQAGRLSRRGRRRSLDPDPRQQTT